MHTPTQECIFVGTKGSSGSGDWRAILHLKKSVHGVKNPTESDIAKKVMVLAMTEFLIFKIGCKFF